MSAPTITVQSLIEFVSAIAGSVSPKTTITFDLVRAVAMTKLPAEQVDAVLGTPALDLLSRFTLGDLIRLVTSVTDA